MISWLVRQQDGHLASKIQLQRALKVTQRTVGEHQLTHVKWENGCYSE